MTICNVVNINAFQTFDVLLFLNVYTACTGLEGSSPYKLLSSNYHYYWYYLICKVPFFVALNMKGCSRPSLSQHQSTFKKQLEKSIFGLNLFITSVFLIFLFIFSFSVRIVLSLNSLFLLLFSSLFAGCFDRINKSDFLRFLLQQSCSTPLNCTKRIFWSCWS